ncbi:hypothetical protein HHI36_014766 [Cryptolaemus montrouzieri]|uniref:Uncharacterized protein n=1 Tax=Cryptolaemus montrouzieri TaxID=559131 RepID=A0ABD2N410_9CUCU
MEPDEEQIPLILEESFISRLRTFRLPSNLQPNHEKRHSQEIADLVKRTKITKNVELRNLYDIEREIARDNLIKSKQTNKVHYDKKVNNVESKVGQEVYLVNEKIHRNKTKELSQNYEGHHKIIEIDSPVNATILIKNKKKRTKDPMRTQHRVKRAWLNIVGSAFETVFGTLDEDDAEQYKEAITKVEKNENRILLY